MPSSSQAWLCGVCSLVPHRDYSPPASPNVRCRECGAPPSACDMLRFDFQALSQKMERLSGTRATAPAPDALGEDGLTTDEAAAQLHISRQALYQRVRRGQIRAHRFGRRLRFSRRELTIMLNGA